ncbi:hypothetical protein DMUE_2235 [Dictyocoela muelleri]|nr:hypothetical protein DMUE_2235 [Dictyocoela muelleri]
MYFEIAKSSECSESDSCISKHHESSSTCEDSDINRDEIGCEIFKKITHIIKHHKNPKGSVRCTYLRWLFEQMVQFLPCEVRKYVRLINNDDVFEAYLLLEKYFGYCDKKKCIPDRIHVCENLKRRHDDCNSSSEVSSNINDFECDSKESLNFKKKDCCTYTLPLPRKCDNKPRLYNLPLCLVEPKLFFKTSMCDDIALIKRLFKSHRHIARKGLYDKLKNCLCSNNSLVLIHAKFCVIKIFTDILVGKKSESCISKYLDILNEGCRCNELVKSKYLPYFCAVLKRNTPILY